MLASLSTPLLCSNGSFSPTSSWLQRRLRSGPLAMTGADRIDASRRCAPIEPHRLLLRPQRLSLFQRLSAFRIRLLVSGSTSWLASLEASSLLGQLWVLYTTGALSDEPMHPTCQHRTSRSKPFRGKSDRIRTLPTMRCAVSDPKPPAAPLLGGIDTTSTLLLRRVQDTSIGHRSSKDRKKSYQYGAVGVC